MSSTCWFYQSTGVHVFCLVASATRRTLDRLNYTNEHVFLLYFPTLTLDVVVAAVCVLHTSNRHHYLSNVWHISLGNNIMCLSTNKRWTVLTDLGNSA